MKKPKVRELTVRIVDSSAAIIEIEAVTDKAQEWMRANAQEFGKVTPSVAMPNRWFLLLYRGCDLNEVSAYLVEKWDSDSWPKEVDESVVTDFEES